MVGHVSELGVPRFRLYNFLCGASFKTKILLLEASGQGYQFSFCCGRHVRTLKPWSTGGTPLWKSC